MIKVASINGGPVFIPKGITNGSNFDGEYFYFFESEEEKINYYASLPPQEIIEENNKIDSSNIDFTTLTTEQLQELKSLLNNV